MNMLRPVMELSLPTLYSQENNPDPLVVMRFYDRLGDWSWYAIEFDGSDLFFGVVIGFERELGFFSLAEFEQINRDAGFCRITQDPKFKPTRVSQIQR